ncbi:unnamed protein product, partial [Oppiella nova]
MTSIDSMKGCINVVLTFCPECNNILYPRQNKQLKRLMYICRTCLFEREANVNQNCVYLNNIKHDINELAQINAEMIADPTLARTSQHPCPKCKRKEAVFMQGSLRQSDDDMKLYYICTDI